MRVTSNSLQLMGKATAKGLIQKGKYRVVTVPGAASVRISSSRIVGRRKESAAPNAPTVDIVEERLPARYNSESTLEFNVQSGTNTKNWDLESR